MCVKSEAQSRPGSWSCAKNTSLGGPSVARQCLIRRWRVRSCPSGKRPGKRRCRSRKRVLASSPGLSRSISSSSGHTSWNGSSRVRQVRGTRRSEGSRSESRYLRAVFSSMPALSAALARVVSVWSNFRSLLNRRSVTIPSLRHRGSRKGTAYRASGAGNSDCRWPGEMIVADQARSIPGGPRAVVAQGHRPGAHFLAKSRFGPGLLEDGAEVLARLGGVDALEADLDLRPPPGER